MPDRDAAVPTLGTRSDPHRPRRDNRQFGHREQVVHTDQK
jgi:hypothetical protein